jgi:restriction system protein
LKYITDGNVGMNIQLESYIYMIVYGILSTVIIKIIFFNKLKNMYLTCDIDDIDEMTGIEFEQFLYFKFRKQGYKVKTTPVSGDYGADLVVKKRREIMVIQAKRYQRDVGIAAVQEVIGSIAYYNASKGMVITNSFFTPNAINLARANDVILWNRKELIHYMIKNHKINDISTDNEHSTAVEGVCPQCGNKLIQRNGKYGSFLGCSSYPDCGYTESVNR